MTEFWYHLVVLVKRRLFLLSERTLHVIVILTDNVRYKRLKHVVRDK